MDFPVLDILWLAVSAGITLFLPGAALLAWLPHTASKRAAVPIQVQEPQSDAGPDFTHQLGRALGLSMALTALGALVTFLTGLRLSAASLMIIYAALGLVGLVGGLRRWRSWRFTRFASAGVILTLLVGVGLVAWRLYQARDLALPAWVDSLHHALIVRAIIDRGGLPGSLAPYMPVPFYYHYGYHALAAVFTVFSRLPLDQALLVFGQVLEAAMSLAAYRLAYVVFRYRGSPSKFSFWPRLVPDSSLPFEAGKSGAAFCGLAAALLVGLVTHMPGYFLTWGRYTLLAGMILLALVIAEVVELVHRPRFVASHAADGVKSWPVLALLTAGLLLTHYLVAVVLALFLGLQAIPYLWGDIRRRKVSADFWLTVGGGVTLGALLALPWLIWVVSHAWSSFFIKPMTFADSGGAGYASYLWFLAGPQRNYWLLGIAGFGLLLAFLRSGMRVMAAWGVLILLICLPFGLRLGPLRPDIMVMMIFLPEVILAAYLLISAGEAVSWVSRVHWLGPAAAASALGLLCLWGLLETRNIVNPVTVIATQSDKLAVTWVDQNLPAQARFYINTTLWQGKVYRGVDGGWWILPLTGRQTLLPPVIYTWGTPDYIAQVNDWASQASQITSCSAEFWQLVQASRVDYIYIHEGVGALQPDGLASCPGIKPVYQVEGVDIYIIQK
jgi:hypothetical protein